MDNNFVIYIIDNIRDNILNISNDDCMSCKDNICKNILHLYNNKCLICYNDLYQNGKLTKIFKLSCECKYVYCYDCVYNIIKTSNGNHSSVELKCPTCRDTNTLIQQEKNKNDFNQFISSNVYDKLLFLYLKNNYLIDVFKICELCSELCTNEYYINEDISIRCSKCKSNKFNMKKINIIHNIINKLPSNPYYLNINNFNIDLDEHNILNNIENLKFNKCTLNNINIIDSVQVKLNDCFILNNLYIINCEFVNLDIYINDINQIVNIFENLDRCNNFSCDIKLLNYTNSILNIPKYPINSLILKFNQGVNINFIDRKIVSSTEIYLQNCIFINEINEIKTNNIILQNCIFKDDNIINIEATNFIYKSNINNLDSLQTLFNNIPNNAINVDIDININIPISLININIDKEFPNIKYFGLKSNKNINISFVHPPKENFILKIINKEIINKENINYNDV